MLNPRDPARPPARPSNADKNDDRNPPSSTWVRPPKAPFDSGMLKNRKLDLHKTRRAKSRRP